MILPRISLLAAGLAAAGSSAPALVAQPVNSVALNGAVYVNHGLVGVGRIPAATRDKFGETFGSFSAFTFQPGSWQRQPDGSYTGVLFGQPDRGYNAAGTTNYQPRFNKLSVAFRPAESGAATQNQVALTLTDTVLFTDHTGRPMTSLDPLSVQPPAATVVTPGIPTSMPTAYTLRYSLDAEGIVVNADGTLWVSDEYGPYVYKFAAEGRLLSVVRPPEALIPKRNGGDSFASNNPAEGQPAPTPADPVTGRQNNQGLEGLSVSPDGHTLFTLLQSATRQDGGTGGSSATRHHTRLLAYDITGAEPRLVGHYVVPLPTYRQGINTRVAAQSELLAINSTQFLVLARDGNGRGTATPTSLYRSVVLYDITGATNLVGTEFETTTKPVSPNGVLDSITPASRADVINLNDAAQLAKFGLTNGPVESVNNLSEKWEALALVPALDPAAPNDWFLFVGNDNDFFTTQGFQVGAAYSAALDNDNVVLVYRLTLPGRLLNVSSRARIGTGADSHIVGFVVNGARPKTVLVRVAGPALVNFGVPGAVADPALQVFSASGRVLATNDNWGDGSNAAELTAATQRVGAFAFAAGSRDSAVLLNLDPGSYTVHAGTSGAAGPSLIEVYELP